MLKHDEDPKPPLLSPWMIAAILAVVFSVWALYTLEKMQRRVEYLDGQFQRLLWDRSSDRVDPPKEHETDG